LKAKKGDSIIWLYEKKRFRFKRVWPKSFLFYLSKKTPENLVKEKEQVTYGGKMASESVAPGACHRLNGECVRLYGATGSSANPYPYPCSRYETNAI
jgi:hypothetical protein